MLSTIRKRLQSILACIFALRIFDNGKKIASASKIRRKKEEQPRKPKKLVINVWESPFGKMLLDPDSSLESTPAGKLFRVRVRVPFSVFQMIVDKFRTIPEWNMYKDPSTKRGRPRPLELKVMASLYILGRAATYDDAAMVTYLSSTVIATIFHHFIVCMAGTARSHPPAADRAARGRPRGGWRERAAAPGRSCCGPRRCARTGRMGSNLSLRARREPLCILNGFIRLQKGRSSTPEGPKLDALTLQISAICRDPTTTSR